MNIPKKIIATIGLVILFSGCSKEDENFIPYSLKGFRIYLYDSVKAPDADHFAGYIPCSYSDRELGLSKARNLARSKAEQLGFDTSTDRYYIFCTVTKDSECATKVR